MAEFKLGRIRFIWKGEWSASTTYYKDDIVRVGGSVYICIAGHASTSEFATDLLSYWNKLSDGQKWRGDWNTATYYNVDDIVKYGGYLYIANTAHLSANTLAEGLEGLGSTSPDTRDDIAKWDLYAEGFDYKSTWTNTTRYKINDVVKYNSTLYICIEDHISAATDALGLEDDQSKWDVFTKGLEWTGDWSTSTRYVVNDVVKYGGQIYVCNTGHTSANANIDGLELDQSKWDYFHKGVEYKGNWSDATRYKINDLVKYGGGIWICTTFHTSTSTFNESNWEQFIEGLEFEDSWNPTVSYQPGDIVSYGGYTYVSKTNNIALIPSTQTADWDIFVTGFNFVGDYAEDSTDQHYRVGDVVTLGGFSYLCILDHETAQRPPNTTYWERLNTGLIWKDAWTDATYYDQGDVVRYGDSSYICVLEHTSDETVLQNRPDQDVDGSEWNLVAGGPETSVLTTDGDIVYYSGVGPTRLGIGRPGQVLKVNSSANAPEWSFLGAINHVYYVETNGGVNEPAPVYGLTLDQPWKTVRYAAEQVDKGALRYNAKSLLFKNRAFIQDEVQAYMTATYSLADVSTFEEDTGKIIDALIWDLSHGGNVRTRKLALTYFNIAGDTYTYATATQAQAADGINLIKTIADAVLSNVAPGTTYGTISQIIDNTYTEEADALSILETLVNNITDAITAGNTTNIPTEYRPTNTIFVKTGEFDEVLPIIVPENCAVVGDELRSTRIKAAGSLINSSDATYKLGSITRLQTIISDVIQNTPITKTTGNGETQVTTRPAGAAAAGTAAAGIIQDIGEYIDFKLNANGTEPTLTGTNTPVTSTDYTYAVEVIEANRTFLVEEIIAYATDTYGAVFDADVYRTDVNRYLDALQYDLIYTGNYKSIYEGRYYVNAVQGSFLEDMFYLRNGTGLRNCTLVGLNGTLSTANSYGTKRPTAGAYTSLDPGWGTTDERAWITNKSPYVQNVTTFGTGCVGCKVDGDLHAGGNDSIVSNDFTQILSDGIGCWVTNLGRSELVSVFSYYGHIGYLAENGGKIRATNGNSSYGDFGTVAEGVDATEVPITGNVSNREFEAIVSRVFTSGNQILTLEYLHAGENYTAGGTTIEITGEGFGAIIDSPQVNNGSVFEVRMLDPNDDFGGAGYITTENIAQEGSSTSLTLSNTEVVLSSQYIGMAIYITSGLGVGQYGYIDTYNAGTKIATIKKFSDDTAGWDHLVPGTAIEPLLDSTTGYTIEPRVTFSSPPSGLYADTAKGRAVVVDGQITSVLLYDTGNGYTSAPTITFTDPNNTVEAPTQVRIGDGVLTQPTWTSRGTGFVTALASIDGDGFMDRYQPGNQIRAVNLSEIPTPGSNIEFGHLSGSFFKLVAVRNLEGTGPYSAQLQVAPDLSVTDAPDHNETIEFRIRYSQVRLTGHDFLDIGTGNFANTNYPGLPLIEPDNTKETNNFGGGRVFYTSTDQDGNFRVGELFSVEQATGVATLNADAFNLSGLQELALGELGLGGTGATITEFSTDGTFTANSDNIVPTQKAIKTYITSQIGGGSATLNVNSITAGQIQISGQQITTTTGNQIVVEQKMNFQKGVDGVPVAMNYFLQA